MRTFEVLILDSHVNHPAARCLCHLCSGSLQSPHLLLNDPRGLLEMVDRIRAGLSWHSPGA